MYTFNIRPYHCNQGDNGPKMTEKLKRWQVHSFLPCFGQLHSEVPRFENLVGLGSQRLLIFVGWLFCDWNFLTVPRRSGDDAHNFKVLMKSAWRFLVLNCHWRGALFWLIVSLCSCRHELIRLWNRPMPNEMHIESAQETLDGAFFERLPWTFLTERFRKRTKHQAL